MPKSAALLALATLAACAIDDDALDDVTSEAAAIPCSHFVSKEKHALDVVGYGTAALPWRTIDYAVNHVGPGARVCVRPGLYPERVQPTISGTAAAPITVVKYGAGEAIIDGTVTIAGFGACPPTIGIYGRSHLRFSGFTITNRGNAGYLGPDCQSSGMQIMPLDGEDSEDIIISNNLFTGIRTAYGTQLGLPLGFGSYQIGASVHHIQIDGNTFRDNDTIAEGRVSPIWVGAVAIVGDAHDWVVRRNTFDDADTGGVELAGNQNGNNLQPMNGVVADNVFLRSGSDTMFGGAGVYNQGGQHILVERNFFDQTGYAVSVHTEPAYANGACIPPLPAGHTVVRNNIMVNTRWNDFRTGANHNGTACNYGAVDSVNVTNNTIFRSSSQTAPVFLIVRNPTAGLVGDNRFFNNIIMTTSPVFAIYGAPPPMTSNYNYVGTPMPKPILQDGVGLTWAQWTASQDQASRFDSYWMSTIFVVGWPAARADFVLSSTVTPPHDGGAPFGVTPAWATFGAYSPTAELDHYGGPRQLAWRRDIGADER